MTAERSMAGELPDIPEEDLWPIVAGLLGPIFDIKLDPDPGPRKVSTAGRKTPSGRQRGYFTEDRPYRPQARTIKLLTDVDSVLDEYRDHWPLTVRQVYYRLVGAYGYDKSKEFYGRLCHHLANARRGRWVPFDAIRDDGVSVVKVDHHRDLDAFYSHVRDQAKYYRRDLLARQSVHIEVWCEAAGMVYQLANVAHPYSVSVYASGGFDSLTAKKDLADRIVSIGKPTIVLHLGDFDPSGVSIFESAAEDVAAFVEADRTIATTRVEFHRVALTDEQVESYQLPTAPANTEDSRAKGWQGETCQLESLPPDVIARLLDDAILRFLDLDQIDTDREESARERRMALYALPGGSE